MNDPVNQPLRETAWRRKLTPAELEALRKTNPEGTADADLEAALSGALQQLPDAPVPSNFTARVLQQIECEEMQPARQRGWTWLWRILVPRTAVAAVILGSSVFAFRHHQAQQRMEAIGESLVKVATVPSLPSPEALENFDAISKLSSDSAADKELLALLQ